MLQTITNINSSIWINASAGSGKTTLLIKRLLALLINKQKNIICITFTNAAAAEMQNRLNSILVKLSMMQNYQIQSFLEGYLEYNKKIDFTYVKNLLYISSEIIKISTIHSFCFSILQEIDIKLQNQSLEQSANNTEFTQIIEEFLQKECSFPTEISSIITEKNITEIFLQLLEKFTNKKNVEERLNKFKNEIANRTAILLKIFNELTIKYQKLNNDKITYNAIIENTNDFISKNQSLLYKITKKIDHILLDEAQDTNLNQWFLIIKLCEEFFIEEYHNKTIFIVGDNKQSIYNFQGANPNIFEGFYSLIKSIDVKNKLKKIEINTCYRCAKNILELVDTAFNEEVIQNSYFYKLRHNVHRINEEGYVEIWPVIEKSEEEDEQLIAAKKITEKIKQWLLEKRILQSKNRLIKLSDIAIFVAHRTKFIDYLQLELQKNNITVNFIGKIKIENNEMLSLFLTIGKFILHPYDERNLIQLLKSPIFGVTDEEILLIKTQDVKINLWNYIKHNSKIDINYQKFSEDVNKTLNDWIKIHGTTFDIYTKIFKEDISQKLKIKYNEQFNFYFDILLDNCNKENSLYNFIEKISVKDATLEIENGNDGVTISTVHGSKGLQYKIVFLADTNYIPRYKEIILYNKENLPFWYKDEKIEYFESIKSFKKKEILEEHLRLLYVALTRAEDELYIIAWGNEIKKGSWYEIILNAFKKIHANSTIF